MERGQKSGVVGSTRLSPLERAKVFTSTYPGYCPLIVHNQRLYSTWVLGALYSRVKAFDLGPNTRYYGSFPYSMKERIYALFPDCQKVAHLFSGTVRDLGTVTYDINPTLHPTICDDIRNIARHEELKEIDLFIADPPYDASDFEKYEQKPFPKAKAISDIGMVAKPDSYLVWLDTRVPMYNKRTWELLGYVGIVVSTNTRMRCFTLLHRTDSAVPTPDPDRGPGAVAHGPNQAREGQRLEDFDQRV